MRRTIAAALLVVAWALSGCSLFDQVDALEQVPQPGRDMPRDLEMESPNLPEMPPSPPPVAGDLGQVEMDAAPPMPPAMLAPLPPAAPEARSMRILVIGNSFNLDGPVPRLVGELASDAGWPQPDVRLEAVRGMALSGHRMRAETLAAVDAGGWDVVVLQEFSTKPTRAIGEPEAYGLDALWFYDRIKATSPEAWVGLELTWARERQHSYYPETFADPGAMLAELREALDEVATRVIPEGSQAARKGDVGVIAVGEVWQTHLARADALRLHASDDYHANALGQYLSAAVIYATLYGRRVWGRSALGRDPSAAARVQREVDEALGFEREGGPREGGPRELAVGRRLRIDCGGDDEGRSPERGWNALVFGGAALRNAVDTEGVVTRVGAEISENFEGNNDAGLRDNSLGWPPQVSGDTLWTGAFSGHDEAITKPGQVTLRGLDPQGRYTLRLFASRQGNDEGRGRLSRYTVGDTVVELDATNNRNALALVEAVTPSAEGQLIIDVAVAPQGMGRFAYLGAIEIERLP